MVVAAKEKQNTKEKTHEMNFRIRANAVKANIEMRTGKKITWNELSERANLDSEVLSRIMNGTQKHIRLNEAIAIATALKTTVSYLSDSPDTHYMLDNTRKFRNSLANTLKQVESQRKVLDQRESETTEQLTYFEYILYNVDPLDEH
jgi:transcriptional regulator with XRE-family HTH domain